MALLMRESVANSEQSHAHGEKLKEDGKGEQNQQGRPALHGELDGELLSPASPAQKIQGKPKDDQVQGLTFTGECWD